MSVTFARGFRASGVVAGLKASGNKDVALVVNEGPSNVAGAVFTSNRIKAAPVQWTQECAKSGQFTAVVLNSGGANACTGPEGFADTHHIAELVASLIDAAPLNIAVCSTGLIGKRLPMDLLTDGVKYAHQKLSADGGTDAAHAIMTTDSVHKVATFASPDGWRIGGMAKGAGMLAPGLATMLVVLTTDADIDRELAQSSVGSATEKSFNRIDSDGCMSTNDTVLLLASGVSAVKPTVTGFTQALTAVCDDLARQLIADAEGATKEIKIVIQLAASEADALEVARAISRSNLLKCAIHGEDPNWGRVLAALGTTCAQFEPDAIDVAINGVLLCHAGSALPVEPTVDLSGREVEIAVTLNAGTESATLWTNDLTAMYVHENSAYST